MFVFKLAFTTLICRANNCDTETFKQIFIRKKNTSAHMTEQAGVVTIVLQVHLNILNYFLLDFSLTFF